MNYQWTITLHVPSTKFTWWRHQLETFSALLAFCAGNSPVSGEFPSQMPVVRSFDVFFDVHLNKRLCKHWRRRWFETSSRSLWRHFSSSDISNLLFCQDNVIKLVCSRQNLAISYGTSRVLILAPTIKGVCISPGHGIRFPSTRCHMTGAFRF